MNRTEIMNELRACDDVDAISDVALMAAMRVHEITSDVKGVEIVLNGTYTKNSKRYSIGITRKD